MSGNDYFCQIILLFNLFLLLFIGLTTHFVTIFQQKVFSFNKISRCQKTLGLDICADIMVGDEIRRGISGGQKKRVTTGAYFGQA